MVQRFKTLGFLRYCHLAAVLVLLVAAPFAYIGGGDGTLAIWMNVIAPALMPMLLFTLPMDVLFCWIRKQDPQPPQTLARLRFITRLNVAAFAVLMLAWTPFILRLLAPALGRG